MKKIGLTLLGIIAGVLSFFLFQYLQGNFPKKDKPSLEYVQLDWKDLKKLNVEEMTVPEDVIEKIKGNVKLPGFVVSIDNSTELVDEFLFVPSQGACIHTPPPPPNLMVLVTYPEKLSMAKSYGPKWLYGKILFEKTENQYGSAGWKFYADKVEDYVWQEDTP